MHAVPDHRNHTAIQSGSLLAALLNAGHKRQQLLQLARGMVINAVDSMPLIIERDQGVTYKRQND